MTRSKIIFDISVEEMSQQRVMRQFGVLQLADPPAPEQPLPAHFHRYVSQKSHPTLMHFMIVNEPFNCRYTRKGDTKSAMQWMQRVGVYVTEWESATTRVWPSDMHFDMEQFRAYQQRYISATRVRIMQDDISDQIPAPSTWDLYPSQSTSGTRLQAVKTSSLSIVSRS